ncbi:hypothetical protein [Spirosoma spitsbergense]|nr:hypothetical protein [Spirosoma spitsbergense]
MERSASKIGLRLDNTRTGEPILKCDNSLRTIAFTSFEALVSV